MNSGLRIWMHEGKGHWIGSAALCLAHSRDEAEAMIRKRLDEAGLKNEPLRVIDYRSDIPGVFFFLDGDY